jgi:hypothetical protein
MRIHSLMPLLAFLASFSATLKISAVTYFTDPAAFSNNLNGSLTNISFDGLVGTADYPQNYDFGSGYYTYSSSGITIDGVTFVGSGDFGPETYILGSDVSDAGYTLNGTFDLVGGRTFTDVYLPGGATGFGTQLGFDTSTQRPVGLSPTLTVTVYSSDGTSNSQTLGVVHQGQFFGVTGAGITHVQFNSGGSGYYPYTLLDNASFGVTNDSTEVITKRASGVGNLSANLNGSVITNLTGATTYFKYGTNTTYGSTTGTQDLVGSTNFSASIYGLAPNTVYHYQAVAVVGSVVNCGNDQTVTTEPSILTLAKLSDDAYSDSPLGFNGSPTYHYFGGYDTLNSIGDAYVSDDDSQIIIAFRGTMPIVTFDGIHNIIADFGFVSGNPSAELQNYASAAALFVQAIQMQYTNANITLTGHSLGGALAQLVGKSSGLTATGFNAPGSASVYPALQNVLNRDWPIPSSANPNINYRIDCDQVSLVGTNFPSLTTIASPYSFPVISGTPLQYLLSVASFVYSCHSIDTVISQIANNSPLTSGIPISDTNLTQEFENGVQPISTSSSNSSQSSYNFDFPVNDASGLLLNAEQTSGGSDFVFSESTGSPGITAVDLPALSGVNSFELRSETGATWSNFQSVQPGTQIPFDPVNGFEFVPLDQNGNPVIETNLVFGVCFASIGAVSGSFTQLSAALNLPFPPLIIGQPANLLATVGSNGIFTVAATSGLPLSYQWQKNSVHLMDGGDISGSATTNLTIYNVSAADAGTYSVIVSNTAGAVTSVGADLRVTMIQNGSFQTGDFTGWTLSGDATYAFVEDGSRSGITPYSGAYESVLGTTSSFGFLSQTLSTTARVEYLLSFWLNSPDGETPNEFFASWDGNMLFDATNIPAIGWTNIQSVVISTGTSTVLQFGFLNNPSYFALDEVSVVPVDELPLPGITGISSSGTSLILNGSNGLSGETYYFLTSTNVAKPLNQWTRVATNVLSTSGNFTLTITNAVNPNTPQGYYILQTQ